MTTTPERTILASTAGPVPSTLGTVPRDAHDIPDLSGHVEGSVDAIALGSVERWDPEAAAGVLAQVRRVLRPGGVLRVSTPDYFDAVIAGYLYDWSTDAGSTRGSRFNAWRRDTHDHRVIYNEEDLSALLETAGFVDLQRFVAGSSSEPAFWGLEAPDAGLLVLEARRAGAP